MDLQQSLILASSDISELFLDVNPSHEEAWAKYYPRGCYTLLTLGEYQISHIRDKYNE